MATTETHPNDWSPEPFPEPRTIPENWHAEALSEKRKPAEQSAPEDDWMPDPFPEPRSFPWNSGR
jgi:hypothetical protein